MLGILRDGQFPGRGRQKTLGFGPEVGKATAQLAEEIAHVRKVRPELVAVADAAPDNWTFLEKLRPNERAVDFFHAISARFPTVATDWYEKYRAVLRDDVGGVDKVALSPRQGDDGTGGSQARTRVFPQAQVSHALREPQSQRLRTPASSANKVLVNQRMKRARWSIEGGVLTIVGAVGPSGMATGAANEAPDAA